MPERETRVVMSTRIGDAAGAVVIETRCTRDGARGGEWETTIRPGDVAEVDGPEVLLFARAHLSAQALEAHREAVVTAGRALRSTVRQSTGSAPRVSCEG